MAQKGAAVPSRDPDLLETLGLSCQQLDPTSKCQGKQEERLRELHVLNQSFALHKSFQRAVPHPFSNSKLEQWLLGSRVKGLVIMQLGWMRPKGEPNGMTFFDVVFQFWVL